jgi:hypothetical protein
MKAPTYAEAKRSIDQTVRTTDGLVQLLKSPTREQRDALMVIGLNAVLTEWMAPAEAPRPRQLLAADEDGAHSVPAPGGPIARGGRFGGRLRP